MSLEQPDLLKLSGAVAQAIEEGVAQESLVEMIGLLVDAAGDTRSDDALVRAIEFSELFAANAEAVHASLALYYASNAWSSLQYLRHSNEELWSWEQPEFLQQILMLRRAIQHPGFQCQPAFRRAQIYCNLGNSLNHAGRFVDALTEWRLALRELPILGMAHGNLGMGLGTYGRFLYDSGHTYWFLRAAKEELMIAVAGGVGRDGSTFEAALQGFGQYLLGVENHLRHYEATDDEQLGEFPLGDSERERDYRRWCLERTLFLNPMNDLGPYTVAAKDTLSVPSHRVEGAGITYRASFNQLVQEFAYARLCLFEGSLADSVHFADKGVGLAYNADLSHYSMGLEQVKTAFRGAYSLLDKIAYFINKYWNLNVPERSVYFHSIWYEEQKGKQPRVVRPIFESSENLPLRGLFWLSKDLFDSSMQAVASPVAKQLKSLRNHLEHKFVKVVAVDVEVENENELFEDHLSHKISRDDLVEKSEHIMRLSRSALIYLSMAMHVEEQRKMIAKGALNRVPMDMGLYPDDLKV